MMDLGDAGAVPEPSGTVDELERFHFMGEYFIAAVVSAASGGEYIIHYRRRRRT